MKKPSPSMSDKALRGALAGLREDVAAPADFRAHLLRRLAAEGLIKRGLPAAGPSLWQRVSPFISLRRRLGWGLSFGLALFAVLHFLPERQAEAPAPITQATPAGAATPAFVAVKPARPLAHAMAPATAAADTLAALPKPGGSLPDALLDEHDAQSQLPAVGGAQTSSAVSLVQQGQGAAAGPGQASNGAGAPLPGAGAASLASAVAKPTVIEPTPTPLVKALDGNSELRGNVIRASRGEAGVLLYRLLKAGTVHVEVFDRLGHSVVVLKHGEQAAGTYELRWGGQEDNGSMAPTGIYVMDVSTPGYHLQHKLAVVR